MYEFGPFQLSTRSWTLKYKDRPLHISKFEFVLLLEFLEHPQTIIPQASLLGRVWPLDRQGGERALAVYVYRLNQILSDATKPTRYIRNVRKKGYEFQSSVKTSSSM